MTRNSPHRYRLVLQRFVMGAAGLALPGRAGFRVEMPKPQP